ncbi:MAG: endopeptidase La [Myxococcota bacterium]
MAASPSTRPASGELPLLPLRSMSLLPSLPQPIELGRSASVSAIERARSRRDGDPMAKLVVVATQRDPLIERPELEDLYPVGILAEVTQALHGVPGRMTAIVRGLHRVRLLGLHRGADVTTISFQTAHESMGDPTLAYALAGALQDLVKQHDESLPASSKNRNRAQSLAVLGAERSPGAICDLAATHVELEPEEAIEVLMELQVTERLRKLMERISHRINVLHVKRDLDKHVRDHLSKHEQEALLRHKLRAIQSQLGDDRNEDRWLETLAARLDAKALTDHAKSEVKREVERLKRMNPQSQEANIARTYLELMADLPWGDADASEDKLDLSKARALLAQEHYGLDKVKKRVIEYLSVRKLAPNKRGPILCLAGPPGVGKTSLARSIADSLGRTFVRMSLGGVRDDAEVRGHRRTYVGALPGRLVQLMRKAGSTNPVFLLDEIDKLSASESRGDPASAFLEALDPEQNDTFEDHYLGTPYDLSKVIFICTANDVSRIPMVLRDRLEFINLTGYTLGEKIAIARDYLVPRALKEHGLGASAVAFEDAAFDLLASRYTRESGVRNLQRSIEAMLRDFAMNLVERGTKDGSTVTLTPEDVERVMGPPRYHEDTVDDTPPLGVVTGLGWTPTGGRLLVVEAATTPGEGKLRLTGRLGSVMKESGQTALSLIRSRSASFGVDPGVLRKHDLHVHVPAGAVPKDGPSAGITVTTAVVSILTGRRVRNDVAMTGEVTLHGKVLAIGGVREKVLAAHRAGATTVILPAQNRKDEVDIPDSVRTDLTLHYVDRVEQVLEIALLDPEPVEAAS